MAQEDWALVCRLFARGSTVRQAAMSPTEVASLRALRRALEPATANQRYILCPGCDQHSGEVGREQGERIFRCPECGTLPVAGTDLAAWKLNEEWFQRSLRRALDIQSHDGVTDLIDGVWRLGHARHSPVVLARDLTRLWREPSVFGRVRTPNAVTRVIAPKYDRLRGHPFDDIAGVEWLPLEEKFMLHGDGISFIGGGVGTSLARAVDPSIPVHGPFSENFRWVSLKGWPRGPIHLSDGQSTILKVLWEANGAKVERIMEKTGAGSDRPYDLFKLKRHEKGVPEHEGPLFAYKLLVAATRSGSYSMPRERVAALVL